MGHNLAPTWNLQDRHGIDDTTGWSDNDIFRHGNDKEIKRENVDLNENKLEDGDKRRKKNDKARFVYLCYNFYRHGSPMIHGP